ncbi:unnamed protein product [Prorocentrum cordatum]|uniref:40S ribosomal protein S21 n=1 Tax=Prorocentrum cordatum TaxID=2364126 RepID=A0ABN9Q2L2_9DINO|nr:unnamed protein product [Polarella glacialis]
MQNDEGRIVDLYIPRKCSATNRLIPAKEHGAVQLNVGQGDMPDPMLPSVGAAATGRAGHDGAGKRQCRVGAARPGSGRALAAVMRGGSGREARGRAGDRAGCAGPSDEEKLLGLAEEMAPEESKVDEMGVYRGEFYSFALAGFIRKRGESDSCLNRLLHEKGLLTFSK